MNTTYYEFPIDLTDKSTSYAWLFEFAKTARSILEIGCSTGFFSQYLINEGCEVTGVEINPLVAKQAEKICKQVIVGDIETTAIQEQITQTFEAVVIIDVLEHLRSPATLLTHIRQNWLKPNGRVIISVPNSGHWIFRREILWGRFPYRQYGLFDKTHLRFFTYTSLKALIANTGYTIKKKGFTINHNSQDDITFACFTPLYRRRLDFRGWMLKLEYNLALIWPKLFVYQFIFELKPNTKE